MDIKNSVERDDNETQGKLILEK